jgi:hypothetical protein
MKRYLPLIGLLILIFVLLPNEASLCAQNNVIQPVGFVFPKVTIGLNTGDAPDTIIPLPDPVAKITPKKLTEHLLVSEGSRTDACQAGINPPQSWQLDPHTVIDTKDKIVAVVQNAETSDTRLRQVTIVDDQIDMYYLQPAYYWGVIPTNYYLHIQANGNSLRMSLQKPNWLAHARNFHQVASEAFVTNVPHYLTPANVAALEQYDLISRDAVMIEIVSAIMYQVPVSPISNSFFVCYILPYLLYILFAIVVTLLIIWFLVRRIRKETGYLIKRVHPIDFEAGDEETDEMKNDRMTSIFRIPKK